MKENQNSHPTTVQVNNNSSPQEEKEKKHTSHEVHFDDVVELKEVNLSPSISPSPSEMDLKTHSTIQKWSKKKYIANIIKSIIYCCTYGALGLCVTSMSWGSTTIAKNTNSDSSQIGFLFTGKGLGYIIGSLTYGKFYELLKEKGKKKSFRERWYKLSGNYLFGMAAFGVVTSKFISFKLIFKKSCFSFHG